MCLCCSKQLRETSKLRCTRPNRTSKCSRCSRFNKSCLAVPVKYFAALEGVQRAGLDLLSEGLHQLSPSHLHLHPAPRARLHPRLLGPWPLLAPRLALLILRLVPAVAPDAALMPPPVRGRSSGPRQGCPGYIMHLLRPTSTSVCQYCSGSN